MINFAGRYYKDAADEVAMALLLIAVWITAMSSGVFTPTTVAGTGSDDDLESASFPRKRLEN